MVKYALNKALFLGVGWLAIKETTKNSTENFDWRKWKIDSGSDPGPVVDGRNPGPADMANIQLLCSRFYTFPRWLALGFCPSTVWKNYRVVELLRFILFEKNISHIWDFCFHEVDLKIACCWKPVADRISNSWTVMKHPGILKQNSSEPSWHTCPSLPPTQRWDGPWVEP